MPLVMSPEQRKRSHPDERLIYVKAGDAVLIHNNLVHSRTRNHSDCDRIHVSVVYSLTCMRSTIDFASMDLQEILSEARKIGGPRLLRLFGDDRNYNERYNCGFLQNDEEMWVDWISSEQRPSR